MKLVEVEAVCNNCGRVSFVKVKRQLRQNQAYKFIHIAACDYCRDGFVKDIKAAFNDFVKQEISQ